MTVCINKVLTLREYRQLEADGRKARILGKPIQVFVPGMAWFEPWYFDPLNKCPDITDHMIERRPTENEIKYSFLSPFYWSDWSNWRPPIAVVCPNGQVWEVDRRSSNGDGWKVMGELPNITCTPSIVAGDYHGWLTDGEFRLA